MEFPEYDFGYHPNGRKSFKDKYGIDPIDTRIEEISKEWKQFRCDAVSSLVKELKSIAVKNKDREICCCSIPLSRDV